MLFISADAAPYHPAIFGQNVGDSPPCLRRSLTPAVSNDLTTVDLTDSKHTLWRGSLDVESHGSKLHMWLKETGVSVHQFSGDETVRQGKEHRGAALSRSTFYFINIKPVIISWSYLVFKELFSQNQQSKWCYLGLIWWHFTEKSIILWTLQHIIW